MNPRSRIIAIIIFMSILGGLFPYILLCIYKYSLFTDFGQLNPFGRVWLFIYSILSTCIGFAIGLLIESFIPNYRDKIKKTNPSQNKG